MTRTPLYEQLAAAGAQFGEYCGTETARSFGDPQGEYRALVSACGVYDLGWHAKIVLTGGDRIRWTNGMVTNNVRDLVPDHGNYNFILNPQGRIQGDLYIYNFGDHLLVDTELWQAPRLKEIFDKYIIMDDVEVTDITDKLAAVAVQGPHALEVLRTIGINIAKQVEPLEVERSLWNDIGISVTRMASEISQTYEIWLAPGNAPKLWNALVAADARPIGTDALEMFRIAAGVPRYGQDIRERDLPQETGQNQALHFAKGCYVGQEIIERIHSRGNVHRQFTGFVIMGVPPAPGAKIEVEGKEVGEITSALRIPAEGGEETVALGYIRKESGEPGKSVKVNGEPAVVVRPPFKEALMHA
ncbi:MAG TPA: aminomethyltransferase family protein [Terriglobales bacterium]|nr:aminomethyltransferase family protein [Terriglobales bacterium]